MIDLWGWAPSGWQLLVLAAASAGAGAINAVAGGGTLLSFPAAMAAGLGPLEANATNGAALTPASLAAAWGYRRELREEARRLRSLLLPSLLGGVGGAALLVWTPQRVFGALVPLLLLGAVALLLWQNLKAQREASMAATAAASAAASASAAAAAAATATASASASASASATATASAAAMASASASATATASAAAMASASASAAEQGAATARGEGSSKALWVAQLAVAIYGGYFGAGMGIVMLALFERFGGADLHRKNALKTALAAVINGAATLWFLRAGAVRAPAALVMTAAASVGGFAGAALARRADPRKVRWAVVAWGLLLAAAQARASWFG